MILTLWNLKCFMITDEVEYPFTWNIIIVNITKFCLNMNGSVMIIINHVGYCTIVHPVLVELIYSEQFSNIIIIFIFFSIWPSGP